MCEVYGVIYLIRNKINNKIYVGQTTQKGGFDSRYNGHIESQTHNQYLKNSIKKYGIENFYIDKEFDIAYSKEELDKLEDMYIKLYETTNREKGYNRKFGGSNGKLTDEQKNKISEIKKYQYKNKLIKHPTKGIGHNEETRLKMSINNKNKIKTICLNDMKVFESETKAADYYKINKSTIHNICNNISLTPKSGLVFVSYDDYLDMSEVEIKNKIDSCYMVKGHKVILLNTLEIFENIGLAKLKYGSCDICSNCKGNRNYSGVYNGEYLQWQYYEEYLVKPNRLLSNKEIDVISNNMKSVICITTGIIFDCIKDGSNYYNIKAPNNIVDCCKHNRNSAGKLKDGTKLVWMYYDEYIKTNVQSA